VLSFRPRGFSMIRRVVFLLVLILGVSPLFAAGYGKFHFGKVTFEPIDAFAYQTEEAKPSTIVILTDFKIDRPAVLAEINTPGAFIVQAADKGSLVIMKLAEPDKCSVGAFLGPTQKDFGLGDSNPAKTITSTSSRIAGECWTSKPEKLFDNVYDFHLTYDVPITVVPKPSKLPAGGGEAGAAYLAMLKADQTPKSLKSPKTATIDGGLMKGDRVNVLIHGIDRDGKKIKGLVALKKIDGKWQVLEQNFSSDQ
jgi:hypothetical protein